MTTIQKQSKERITDAFEELSVKDQEIFYETLAAMPVITTTWERMIDIIDDGEFNQAVYKVLELAEEVFDAID